MENTFPKSKLMLAKYHFSTFQIAQKLVQSFASFT